MDKQWWKEAVVYQIYPRSFMDSNGDGVGDLQGILSKLDYLARLGVSVVWLSPVYRSPNDDNGYDISDYRDIMTEFGTLADWDEVLAGMHRRGIKLVMDLVVNHTSDEHPWFVESRSSKDNPKRDWYLWRPGKDGREPSDWMSFFSPSAWELDPATGEYYLHLFSKKQPDLNWENPLVRREVYDLMQFWLDRGIDGFRMDVINVISKVPGFPSVDPGRPGYRWGGQYFFNGPRVHEYLQEMHREVLAGRNLITVGETPGVTVDDGLLYVDADRHEVNMLFQFEMMEIDAVGGNKWDLKPWTPREFKAIWRKWQTGLEGKGWNSLYLNNHDQPRQVSRFGDEAHRVVSAKMLATLLHTLPGTPYVYQGEELGMTNVRFDRIEDYQDIETHNFWTQAVVRGGMAPTLALKSVHAKSRDNARTPMQWTAGPQGGFTTGRPWLPVNPNHTTINAEAAEADPDSVFHHYRRLLELRKTHPVMVYGDFQEWDGDHDQAWLYTRTLEGMTWLVALNLTGFPATVAWPGQWKPSAVLAGNYSPSAQPRAGSLTLRPYEAVVCEAERA